MGFFKKPPFTKPDDPDPPPPPSGGGGGAIPHPHPRPLASQISRTIQPFVAVPRTTPNRPIRPFKAEKK